MDIERDMGPRVLEAYEKVKDLCSNLGISKRDVVRMLESILYPRPIDVKSASETMKALADLLRREKEG